MKTKLIKLIACLITAIGLFCSASFAMPVFAMSECRDHQETAPEECAKNICDCGCVSNEVKQASGCPGATSYDVGDAIQWIINRIILVLGIVAVIAIIIGGVLYMTSAGDAGKIKKAKDTIMYACIGLIICVLSAAIVNFVISILPDSSTPADEPTGYLLSAIFANLL